jgi:hypothetical protein
LRLTEKYSGKYLKKLTGRTDIEDALKRLEKLANEEVRMAIAQGLKATHAVDDRVRVVENKVLDVDNKVAVVIDGAQPFLISQQDNIFNSDVFRGKRDKGGHTTSRRRHRSCEELVIFFLR